MNIEEHRTIKSLITSEKAYKLIMLFSICIFLFSCTNEPKENIRVENVPNYKIKKISIETQSMPDKLELINSLKTKLEKNDFSFEEQEVKGDASFDNCEENTIISIKGNGIRTYFARSRKPAKNTEDFYPDFTIQVFEFQTEKIAKEKFEIMNNALQSKGEFCNGKAPQTIVMNKNEVFLFSTRAEMFRSYIVEYSEFVQKI